MDANKGHTSLWLLDLARRRAQPRRLTDAAGNDSSPRWAPDGRTLYFLSPRSGSSQVWRLSLAAATAQRVTDYPLDVGSFTVSPRGDRLAVSMEVFPDCASLECTHARLDARAKDQASGRTLRADLRAALGQLEQRHALAPVCRGTARERLRRRAGRCVARLRCGHSGQALRRRRGLSPSARTAARWCSRPASPRAASRGPPTSISIRRPLTVRSTAPVNLSANNPAWDAQPVLPRQRRPRLARTGSARLRVGPFPHHGEGRAQRRGARR